VDAGLEEITLRQTLVRDLMRSDLLTTRETDSLDQILHIFEDSRRDVVYVVGEQRELLGLVRLHDVKEFLNQGGIGPLVIAADVMQQPPSVTAEASLAEVIEAFDEPELEELPVLGKAGSAKDPIEVLLGRITRRDVIACMNLEVLRRESLRAKFVVEGADEPTYVELPKGYILSRVPVPAGLEGVVLAESGIRGKYKVTILSMIETDGRGIEHRSVPDPELVLHKNHTLVVMGTEADVQRLREAGA
jgi:CBS domain-containing protein